MGGAVPHGFGFDLTWPAGRFVASRAPSHSQAVPHLKPLFPCAPSAPQALTGWLGQHNIVQTVLKSNLHQAQYADQVPDSFALPMLFGTA